MKIMIQVEQKKYFRFNKKNQMDANINDHLNAIAENGKYSVDVDKKSHCITIRPKILSNGMYSTEKYNEIIKSKNDLFELILGISYTEDGVDIGATFYRVFFRNDDGWLYNKSFKYFFIPHELKYKISGMLLQISQDKLDFIEDFCKEMITTIESNISGYNDLFNLVNNTTKRMESFIHNYNINIYGIRTPQITDECIYEILNTQTKNLQLSRTIKLIEEKLPGFIDLDDIELQVYSLEFNNEINRSTPLERLYAIQKELLAYVDENTIIPSKNKEFSTFKNINNANYRLKIIKEFINIKEDEMRPEKTINDV